jgi:hypothetical protein
MNYLIGLFLKYWWILAIAALLGYIGVRIYDAGQADTQKDWDASVARGIIEVEKLKKKQVVVTTKVETKYLTKTVTIREKARAIETVREVFVPVDSGSLPGGFRLFYDAAITGAIPEAASITDAAPVSIADVADTHARNSELCRIAYATVEGWQEWAGEQQGLNP